MTRLSREKFPAYNSQPNGGTEVGVMLVRWLFRTLGLALESEIEKHIPIGHALVPWLIEHAALLLNVKSRGQTGSPPRRGYAAVRSHNSFCATLGRCCASCLPRGP